jgi:hypothetical protein
MRYKVFTIIAEVHDYYSLDDIELSDIELSDIEVDNIQIVNSPVKVNPHQVLIREDHVAFNFDIWADDIDFIDFTDFTKMHMKGSVEVNSFIDDNFPHIKDYYGSQI